MAWPKRTVTPAQLAHPDVSFLLNMFLADGDEPTEPDPSVTLRTGQTPAWEGSSTTWANGEKTRGCKKAIEA
jgi:hypothetical protein